jgi:hypothetical protein
MKPFAILLIFATTLTMSCTKEDTKCDGIVCQNGGVCNDGTCDCAAGFTGTNCEIELEPLNVIINQIIVTRFPPTKDNGETWDNSGGKADLRGFLFSTAGEVFRSGEVDNVNHNARTKLPQDNPIVMNATDAYRLSLVDDDNFSSDDFLGSHDFIPYSTNNGKPSTLFYSNARIAFELKVTYGY